MRRALEGPLRWLISALAVAWLLNKNGNVNHAVHAILKALAKLAGVSKIELSPTSVLYAGIARRALPFARYLQLQQRSPKAARAFSPESPPRFKSSMPSIDEGLDLLALPPSSHETGLTIQGAGESLYKPTPVKT